jgi:hypothetical protein
MGSVLGAIALPPTGDAMPKTAETIFNIFIFIPLGIALAIAVRQLLSGKGPLLLYCIIGGAFAATFEPIVDVLGLVFLKEHHALGTFTILGRTMPLYICFVYPWYVGGLAYLAYRLFSVGISRRNMFALWLVVGVVDIGLELPGILAHTYLYYGKQPFDIFGFPLWWAVINPVMPMLAGAFLYKILPELRSRWAMLAIIPLVPMADGIANAATGFPMWIALNQTHQSYVWTYIAFFITLGLALFCVWILSLAVARPAEEVAGVSLWSTLKKVASPSTKVSSSPPAVAPRQPVGVAGS